MAKVNEINMVKLIEDKIESSVKESVINILVEKHVKLFKDDLRAKIHKLVNEITFSDIKHVHNMLGDKSEFGITINWMHDKEEIKTPT